MFDHKLKDLKYLKAKKDVYEKILVNSRKKDTYEILEY